MNKIPRILSWIAIIFLVIVMAMVNNQYPIDYAKQNAVIPISESNLKSEIKEGFQKGNAALIYPYFDEIISLCIQEKEDFYLAYNAKAALTNFFEAFPPKQFELKHDGKSKGGQETYLIGDYTTKTGIEFRVYIFLEKDLIQEIEISSDDMIL